ncbi:hypothetical protein Y032_0314g2246 [Ancylostoma ceylanicum]|uniref:C2H2-type domain-containing protein n=1 Tax=Ancylostoma ceylanicum TaxID=53326 RepID=A0A016S1V7_9BILA|nr:hypothetical protein Y032_0314g2246 [Ancylostoma ceylanicum]
MLDLKVVPLICTFNLAPFPEVTVCIVSFSSPAAMPYVVDVYPTEEEIVRNEGELICQLCGKSFSNISARRLHTVKTHGILSCEGDRRIFEKVRDGHSRTYIYHCPAEPCRKKSLSFDGMRNLKQHYFRVGFSILWFGWELKAEV